MSTFIKTPELKKRKVLIIENDQDIRDIVAIILEQEGFETLSIPEPENLAKISSFAADVILLDEFINSRPGHRLCLKIKKDKDLMNIPVIILSTANNIELIVKECNANNYIRKPFDIADVVERVMQTINHQPITL
jgi:DNA-binding response OmpR family regulator